MGLDVNNKNGFFVDEFNLILCQNRDGSLTGDIGMGDCIGTTADAYRAYHYKPFLDGIMSCFVDRGDYLQAYRHPSKIDKTPNTMSRDHIAYALYIMKYAGKEDNVKYLSKKLRWKISDRFKFTIDLWLYMKAIAGSRLALAAYYLIAIPYLLFNMLYKRLVFKICGLPAEMKQSEWKGIPPFPVLPKWKYKMYKGLFPMYSLYQTAFLIDVLPRSPFRWLLRKILLIGTDKQNFITRLMLGDKKVNKEDVYAYKAMWGGRFTSYLSALDSRNLEVITDPKMLEANVVEVDLLREIYREKIGN